MNVILRYAFAFIFSGKGFGNSDKKGETVNLRKIFRLKKPSQTKVYRKTV